MLNVENCRNVCYHMKTHRIQHYAPFHCIHSLLYSAMVRFDRAWDRSDRARDRARGMELGIGPRIDDARRTALASVS